MQTPFLILLRKSGLSKLAGKRLEFHMNFKVVSKFDHVVNTEESTVSLNFVREFEDEGSLISPANFRLSFVLSTLAHHDNSMLKQVVAESNRYGLFVTQIQPKSVARVRWASKRTGRSWMKTERFTDTTIDLSATPAYCPPTLAKVRKLRSWPFRTKSLLDTSMRLKNLLD